jgi:S1-C subfamily serine protease
VTVSAEESPEPIPLPEPLRPPPQREAEAARPSKPSAPEPRGQHCPRCGYLSDPSWRYCSSCGWDLHTLTGDAAGDRLERIQQAAVGLVVVKNKLGFEHFLSPKQLKKLRRYVHHEGQRGQVKIFASAFPYGEDGLFVTSARALHRGVEARFRSYRNHFFDAEILGYDLPSGIGVLKADAKGAAALRSMGSESDPGDLSWIICYPVSADTDTVRYLPASIHGGRLVDRVYFGTNLISFETLLRTDHTLPDGCIGALMVDSYGTSAGVVLGSPDAGITYARPLADAAPIVETLARGDRMIRPYYGMGLVMPDERRRVRFALPSDVSQPIVAYLISGSPAETAGVRAGDILVAINGEATESVVDAGMRLLSSTPGGPAVGLTLNRRGETLEIAIVAIRRPVRVLLDPADEIQETLEANLIEVTTGRSSEHGLRVAQLVRGGRGELQGYKEGDIIQKINRDAVRRADTFNELVRKGNEHIFEPDADDEDDEEEPALSTYVLDLMVRTAEAEKEGRTYVNFFPDVLAAPVY